MYFFKKTWFACVLRKFHKNISFLRLRNKMPIILLETFRFGDIDVNWITYGYVLFMKVKRCSFRVFIIGRNICTRFTVNPADIINTFLMILILISGDGRYFLWTYFFPIGNIYYIIYKLCCRPSRYQQYFLKKILMTALSLLIFWTYNDTMFLHYKMRLF